MYTFLFKVNYHYDGKDHTSFHQINADTFVIAVQKIENYYGNDLTKIEVMLLDNHCGKISEAEYHRILTTL